jgi:hypothetical protein
MNSMPRLRLGKCLMMLGLLMVAITPCRGQDNDSKVADSSKVVFEESFRDSLTESWQWLRPQHARWCLRNGGLEIRVWAGFADSVENALLYQVTDRGQDRWRYEVTVENLSQPKQQWEQAGLTWYSDGRPVFKVVKELVDGKIIVMPGNKPVGDDAVQLKLEVEGPQIRAYYRTEFAGPYLLAGEGQLPQSDNEQVSIQCYHGPTDAEHWIRFTDFRVLRREK